MTALLRLLTSWGYLGMLIAAFIAGSIFPFSSETVLAALQVIGLDPLRLFLYATVGNVAGSMFNYWVGTFGRLEWIERYLHVNASRMEHVATWMQRYGAWIGVLCFLPFIGSVVAVTLGFTRANPYLSFLTITLGKASRYALLIFAVAQL